MKTRPPKAALAAVHLRDIGTSRWQLNRPYTDVACKWKRQERRASFQLALQPTGLRVVINLKTEKALGCQGAADAAHHSTRPSRILLRVTWH